MNKKNIGAVVITLSLVSSTAYAGFERNITSETEDRRAMTEAAQEQSKLLKELVDETRKTNELLKKFVGVESKRSAGSEPSRADEGAGMEDSIDEESGRRTRRAR